MYRQAVLCSRAMFLSICLTIALIMSFLLSGIFIKQPVVQLKPLQAGLQGYRDLVSHYCHIRQYGSNVTMQCILIFGKRMVP